MPINTTRLLTTSAKGFNCAASGPSSGHTWLTFTRQPIKSTKLKKPRRSYLHWNHSHRAATACEPKYIVAPDSGSGHSPTTISRRVWNLHMGQGFGSEL